jgi:hypothetical protein
MSQKKCDHCGEWKDEEEFGWKWKYLGIRNKTCKKCMHKLNKSNYREAARAYVIQYLLTHPCIQCRESDV